VDVATLCARFAAEGVWIRPMGKVVYLTPPFTISRGELAQLTTAICKVLGARAC
jgi:adenosylmethionine-8-amino-7-oxononanoate aminotransferase